MKERFLDRLENFSLLRLLRILEPAGILFAIVLFWFELRDRPADRQNQAWSIVAANASAVLIREAGEAPSYDDDSLNEDRSAEVKSRDAVQNRYKGERANIGLKTAIETLYDDSAQLANLRLPKSYLRFLDLSPKLFGPSFASLPRSNFIRSDITCGRFAYSNLKRAIFIGADLDGAVFSESNLRNADFGKSSLLYVDFTGANLKNTKFDGADVIDADFCGPKKSDGRCSKPSLHLEQEQINKATFRKGYPPQLPDGIEMISPENYEGVELVNTCGRYSTTIDQMIVFLNKYLD